MQRYVKALFALILAVMLCAGMMAPAAAAAKTITGTARYVSGSQAVGASEKSMVQTTKFEYSDAWFAAPSTTYNHALARMSLTMNKASWTAAEEMDSGNKNAKADAIGYASGAQYVDKLYKDIGFQPVKYAYYDAPLDDERDKCAYVIAEKWMTIGGKSCVVLSLTIRGGNYGGEWVSNGKVGDGPSHAGFQAAADDILPVLQKQIDSYGKNVTVKLWVNGYSRSGSVSNLLVAALDRGIAQGKSRLNKDDVYAYCFAVPLCTKDTDAQADIYSNIFNIINPVDIIMIAPMHGWGFGRYGVEKYLQFLEPGEEYDRLNAEYAKAFDGVCDDEFSLNLVTWEQFKIMYLIAKIVPAAMPTTGDLMGFQEPMMNLIRSFFVQGVLIKNIEAGDWEAAYTGIIGKDPVVWEPGSRVAAKIAQPINTLGALFGGEEQTVDPGLLSMILCIGGRAAAQIVQTPPDLRQVAGNVPAVISALVRYAAIADDSSDDEEAQGFVDNIKAAHTTESYMILMSVPEDQAFGTGETRGMKVN